MYIGQASKTTLSGSEAHVPPFDESAPSQANMSPVTPVLPEYPFQHVVADYFHLNGFKYLVYADRFSGGHLLLTQRVLQLQILSEICAWLT